MTTARLLRQSNYIFSLILLTTILSLVVLAFGNFTIDPALVFTIQLFVIMITAITVAIVSKRRNRHLGKLSASVLVSVALLYSLSLVGFFTRSTVVGEFDSEGTWVVDRSVSTALADSLDTSSFIAALFGYDCNSSYGPNCSDTPYIVGFIISEATLVGGVTIGNVLARKDLLNLSKAQ